jgi:hypothetical protein
MSAIYFTEEQSIPSSWRMMIFGGITVFMAFIAFMVFQTEWDTMPAGEKPYLLTLLLGPLGTLVLFFIRLDIRITSSTFEYKVHPFRRNYKVIPFHKISQIELMKPKGLKSFQGVGTHRNIYKTEMNFGGKYLLLIRLTNGRLFSFTTNKPQEIKSFLLSLPEGSPTVKIEI